MVQCFAPGCNHQGLRETCSMFRFPPLRTKHAEYKKWVKMCRRADREPKNYDRLCSCHFKNGLKANGPSTFKRNENTVFQFLSPEKRSRKEPRRKLDFTGSVETPATPSSPLPSMEINVPTPSAASERNPQDLDLLIANMSIEVLEHQVEKLERELEAAKNRFSYKRIVDCDQKMVHYTGLPSSVEFLAIVELCKHAIPVNYFCGWTVKCLPLEDQVMMTLMKLRCNFSHLHLSVMFETSTTTVSNVTLTWIHALHEILFEGMEYNVSIPSLAKNKTCLPSCFTSFSSCRMILDCTEVQCEIPSQMELQCSTFSHYKQRNTFKALVGVAPNGVITYASHLYPGSASDKSIVQHCQVLRKMEPGDLVLADKGFLIQDLMPSGVNLNLPPFLTKGQFTRRQAEMTVTIARARIHVERAIQRIKSFSILNLIPPHYRSYSSIIFQLCSCLVNMQNPLIREIEQTYSNE